jgi:hypothetical protein
VIKILREKAIVRVNKNSKTKVRKLDTNSKDDIAKLTKESGFDLVIPPCLPSMTR